MAAARALGIRRKLPQDLEAESLEAAANCTPEKTHTQSIDVPPLDHICILIWATLRFVAAGSSSTTTLW